MLDLNLPPLSEWETFYVIEELAAASRKVTRGS